MNKSKFLVLVKNPDLIEDKDLSQLAELASACPYSQVVHALNLKGLKAFNKPGFEKALNLASVYTYDRGVLRNLVEGTDIELISGQTDQEPSSTASELEPEIHESSEPAISEEAPLEDTPNFEWIDEEPEVTESEEAENVATDLASGLIQTKPETTEETEKADEAIANEEQKVEDQLKEDQSDKSSSKESGDQETEIEVQEEIVTDNKSSTENVKEASKTSSEEEDLTVSDQADSDMEEETPATPESPLEEGPETGDHADIGSDKDTSSSSEESLDIEIEASGIHAELMKNLNQLQESRQQYKELPESPDNRQEQIEIIDNFIKNSPVLSKPNLSAESEVISQQDLAKKSAKFSDELASENLAKILLKQGKKKDAVKIYEKLIVKFPQKKSYFANQIKKLKKK